MSHQIVDGVPHINEKPAIRCADDDRLVKLMDGALAPWLCPECKAHLSGDAMICMNLCHLSAASERRFNAMLGDATANVGSRGRRPPEEIGPTEAEPGGQK